MSQFIFPPASLTIEYQKPDAAGALPSQLAIIGGYSGTAIKAVKVDGTGQIMVGASALPTGAATSALQTAGNNILTTIDADTSILAGAVASGQMQVDVVASLPTGSNQIGKLAANDGVDIGDVDVTSIIPGVGATNLGKAIQSPQGTTDTGVPALVVRNDTLADLSGADGDYSPLQVNATGALYTTVDSSALPTGAATSALQTSSEALLTTIDADTSTLAGAVSGTEMQVDVITSALPSGAATSALQTTANGILTTIDADTSSLAGCVSGTEVQVDVVSGSVVVDTYTVVDFIDSTVAGYVADNGVIELSGTNTIPAKAASQLQLVSTSAATIKKIQTVEDIGEYMGIFTGASTSETLACVLPLGGGEVSVEIASGSRISIRALTSSTAITSGSLGINFLG
jgi:hypothetical protein